MSKRPELPGCFLKLADVAVVLITAAAAQTKSDLARRIDSYRAAHEDAIIREFSDLLAIPNVASDTSNIQRNAEYVSAMLQKRGIRTEMLKTESSPPIVYGELPSPGAKHTIIFYAHY